MSCGDSETEQMTKLSLFSVSEVLLMECADMWLCSGSSSAAFFVALSEYFSWH